MSSVRSIGHSWEELQPRDVPVLFGGGGWQDEVQTALIKTSANTQREETQAIQDGMGERALDKPEEQKEVEAYANANNEFSYAQFKTGMEVDETMGRVQLTTVRDGAVSGDMLMKVDPRSSVYDQTLNALGDIHKQLHHTKEDVNMDASAKDVAGGGNPFTGNVHVDVVDDSGRRYKQPTGEYIYGQAKPSLSAQQQAHINTNQDTGLRRVNIKKNQGTLLDRMVLRKSMDESHQSFEDAIAEEQKQHNRSYVGEDARETLLKPSRFEGSDMVATQQGVANLSKAQATKYQRSKHGSLLSNAVVGS